MNQIPIHTVGRLVGDPGRISPLRRQSGSAPSSRCAATFSASSYSAKNSSSSSENSSKPPNTSTR